MVYLRVRFVFLANCITGQILVQLLFAQTRVFNYQWHNCNYFYIQTVTIMKFSERIHLSIIAFIQTLG